MASNASEGLKVVPDQGMQFDQAGLHPVYVNNIRGGLGKSGNAHIHSEVAPATVTQKRLCDMRRTTFWPTAALRTVVMIAVAVSTGVAVSLNERAW